MSGHLVLCNWCRALDWIREVHSGIVIDKRPVVIVHNPDEVVLPDKLDEAAFATSISSRVTRPSDHAALGPQAHSIVILADDRQEQHADGKTIVCCIAVKTCAGMGTIRTSWPSARIEIPGAHAQGGCR
jgi:hypothetical protein